MKKPEIVEIFEIIINNIRNIIKFSIIVAIISIIYLKYFAKPTYRSESKITSSQRSNSLAEASGIAAQFGFQLPLESGDQKWVYPEIIKSRQLLDKLLVKNFTTIEFGANQPLLKIITYGNEEPEFKIDTLMAIGSEVLFNMISVNENIKSGIMTLSVDSREAKLSKQINEELIFELDAHQNNYNRIKSSKTRQFIEKRINETKKELESAENRLKQFLDQNRRIENSPALRLEQDRLSREVGVLNGVFTTLKQQLETAKIEEVKDSDYVNVIDKPYIPIIPIKPRKMLILFIIVLATILSSAGYFVLSEILKSSKYKYINSLTMMLYNKLKFKD